MAVSIYGRQAPDRKLYLDFRGNDGDYSFSVPVNLDAIKRVVPMSTVRKQSRDGTLLALIQHFRRRVTG